MMTSDLIKILQESMEMNGDMPVNVCTDGMILNDLEVNVTEDALYVEGYLASSFIGDDEKMHDFFILSKDEFLSSYDYLSEKDYDLTVEDILKHINNNKGE